MDAERGGRETCMEVVVVDFILGSWFHFLIFYLIMEAIYRCPRQGEGGVEYEDEGKVDMRVEVKLVQGCRLC